MLPDYMASIIMTSDSKGLIAYAEFPLPEEPTPMLPATLKQGTVINLKSNKGDFLHRPAEPGVATWSTGIGNEWSVEVITGNKIRLRTWRADYLYRTNDPKDFLYPTQAPNGVTTRSSGGGDEWTVEVIEGNKIRLRSFKDDCLNRADVPGGVNMSNTGAGSEWIFQVVRPAPTPAPAP
ncbi:MAG: hypothetical protein ACK5N0_00865 [Synechococcaceae cyanobacterium]